jgi:hypothetical protein
MMARSKRSMSPQTALSLVSFTRGVSFGCTFIEDEERIRNKRNETKQTERGAFSFVSFAHLPKFMSQMSPVTRPRE